jgi:hypothetical protein
MQRNVVDFKTIKHYKLHGSRSWGKPLKQLLDEVKTGEQVTHLHNCWAYKNNPQEITMKSQNHFISICAQLGEMR